MSRAKASEATFDLSALRKEAKDDKQPFVLIYDGDKYELPPPREIDVETLAEWAQAVGEGNAVDARSVTLGLRALLGDRYEEFRKYRVTVEEAAAIFEAWGNHYGLAAGESSASPSS
jgi:hypothetical protein